jgi:TonB family protein
MNSMTFAAILAATTVGAAPTSPSGAEISAYPIAGPSGEDMAATYPDRAQARHIPGSAVLNCAIAGDGRLVDCRVTSEDPPGYDFGKAALRVATSFRFKTTTEEGQPTVGRRVTRQITWRITD